MKSASRIFGFLLSAVLGIALVLNFSGCDGGGNNGVSETGGGTTNNGSTGGGVSDTVRLSGSLDGSSIAFSSRRSPGRADTLAGSTIDGILAVGSEGNEVTVSNSVISGNDFSVTVSKDKPQLLVFLNGTNVVGAYKVDGASDLDSFPMNSNSTDISLGTVSRNAGNFSGTLSQSGLFNALGVDAALANAFGIVDNGILRLGSLDADGNGILDYFEDKWHAFIIHFEFDPGSFGDMAGNYSLYNAVAYDGYGYYLHLRPYDTSLDWETGGTLLSPQDINGTNNKASGPASVSDEQASMDFYWDNLGADPATPPAGTYIANVPGAGGTAGGDYTFTNVKTQTIDANLYNIYIPTLKLTMSNDRITLVELKWWKKISDGSWVNPSDTELSMILHDASIEMSVCSSTDQSILFPPITSFTNPQSITPPAHDFTPGCARMIYTDKFGFVYGFSWN